jgi:hypothetical protein
VEVEVHGLGIQGGVQLARGQQRAQLRGEQQRAVALGQVEWLLSHPVAREHEPLLGGVP